MYSLVSTEPVTTSLPDTGASDATAAPFAWCETHKAPTHRRGLALIVGKLHPPIKRRQRDTKGIRTSDRPGSTGLSCATLGGHTTPSEKGSAVTTSSKASIQPQFRTIDGLEIRFAESERVLTSARTGDMCVSWPSRPTHRISVRTLISATGKGTCGLVVKSVGPQQDSGGSWIAACCLP